MKNKLLLTREKQPTIEASQIADELIFNQPTSILIGKFEYYR